MQSGLPKNSGADPSAAGGHDPAMKILTLLGTRPEIIRLSGVLP
jgi:hypothetical protein